jgi:hypothetical protein
MSTVARSEVIGSFMQVKLSTRNSDSGYFTEFEIRSIAQKLA